MSGRNVGGLLLGAALLAGCSDGAGPSSAGATGEPTASMAPTTSMAPTATTPTPTAPGKVLFADSFDDDRNGWGIVDDADYGITKYDAGDYVWDFRGSIAHWLPAVLGDRYDAGKLDMLDVTVRTEATVLSGDGVIGVFCRETPDKDAEFQWYEFVARDGFAAIRRADLEGNIDVLADTKDVSLPSGEPMTVEATCVDTSSGDARLDMSLNGDEVLNATDDHPLGNGVSGLQAYTHPIHAPMDIRWHDFTVEQPGT